MRRTFGVPAMSTAPRPGRPPSVLLCLAPWGQIAFARPAALVVRGGVVQVAAHGGPAAPGRGAARVTGPDQVGELAAGVVAHLAAGVVAGTPGDRSQRSGRYGQLAE